jgi:hypothetical protein
VPVKARIIQQLFGLLGVVVLVQSGKYQMVELGKLQALQERP